MPLRQLLKVNIQFTPSDPRSAAVREFLKRCLAPKARESNPDCVVVHKIRSDDAPPVVAVEFVNGFRDQFNCHKFTVNDIIQRIRNVSNEMETKGLLADAGLKSGEMDLRGVISGKLQGRQQEKRVSRR